MAHYAELLKNIFEMSGYESYLELGIWTGTVIDVIPAKRKVGVDIEDRRTKKDYEFFLGTTDQYFKENYDRCSPDSNVMYDMIFIDAQHDFESVKKDLMHSFDLLTERGLICLHDADPADPKFYKDCGDVWKIREYIYSLGTSSEFWHEPKKNSIESITLPIQDGGMTFVKFATSRRQNVI